MAPTLTHGPSLDVIDPGANLGWYSLPELQHAGKSDPDPDEDEDDEDEGEDEGDDDEGDDDPDEGKSEADLKAELKAVRDSLTKASSGGKSKRQKIKRLEGELAAAKATAPKVEAGQGETPAELEARIEAAKGEGRKEGEAVVIAAKAEAALSAAGVQAGKGLARLVKLLDVGELALESDGTVDGLDEQIDELKEDYPELFAKPRRKRESVSGKGDRNGGDGGAPTTSASARQARAITGRK